MMSIITTHLMDSPFQTSSEFAPAYGTKNKKELWKYAYEDVLNGKGGGRLAISVMLGDFYVRTSTPPISGTILLLPGCYKFYYSSQLNEWASVSQPSIISINSFCCCPVLLFLFDWLRNGAFLLRGFPCTVVARLPEVRKACSSYLYMLGM